MYQSAAMTVILRLLASLALIAFATAAGAAEKARVMLVFDASGSMWREVDGRPMIDIAKEVVGKVVDTWRPVDELGLVAYGHRQKGSCDDIEVLSEPGPLDKDAFMSTVRKLNPKGKTPMTAAVKIAAEALRYSEEKSTVILVSDGLETCGLDPCSIASELERQGVDFTMHTIGFNVDDPEAKTQLQCLAENTGGIAVSAETPEELLTALVQTVAATTEEPPPEPQAEPEPETALEFNLTGHALIMEGQELYAPFTDVIWEISRMAADGTPAEHVDTRYGADLKTKIEPGEYVVEVRAGNAARRYPLEVAAGKPYVIQASLNAGALKLTGRYDETTEVTAAQAVWEIYSPEGQYLHTLYGSSPSVLLNDGAYTVKLILGETSGEEKVEVKPGSRETVVIKLGAGILVAVAEFAPGGPPVTGGMNFEVRKGEAGLDGQHQWIATKYDATSQFNLPAGKYLLVCALDYAKGQSLVELKPGETVQTKVVLDAGYLAFTPHEGYVYEIHGANNDISGKRKYVSTDYGGLNKAFNAGTYHAVVKNAQGETVHEAEYVVKAGERTEGTLP
jgi:Ca-activated chloride channel homolog